MAGPSRIDELRKKFDENPRRYFAPLANEYRKIGDFDQAIFICQEFLPQQPGHMSGHIVYGQALFEAGRHDEARAVFETALALDPENLIALRHLGDIARAHGDSETARAWYRRVLESDPRNEEIAGILSSLDAEESGGPPAPPLAPAGSSEASATHRETQSPTSSGASELEHIEPAAVTKADEPLTNVPSESTFDELAKLFTTPEAAPPSSPTPEAPVAADDTLGLIHEGEDVLGRAAQMEGAREPSAIDGVVAGTDAQSAPSPTPTFSAPFLDALGATEPPSVSAPPVSPPPPAAVEESPPQAAAPEPKAAFVTETMAELYLKQGHYELAIDVYRKLVAARPDDAALRARLAELERPTAPPPQAAPSVAAVADIGPTIREFLASIAGFRPRAAENGAAAVAPRADAPGVAEPPPAPNDSTLATSLHSLFASAEAEPERRAPASAAPVPPHAVDLPLLQDAAPAAPASSLDGKPSAPAPNELSLDHVFRHATPAAGAGAQPPSFSFDQFFSQQAHQDVSAAESESGTEGSGGASDDIQQFNAWLEGLKKT